jgi:pantetheine-phosphate adenylyltransferase
VEKGALYAGSFDPCTLGHIWMIKQGINLFDRLIVAVGLNPDKQPYFSMEDRIVLLKQATSQFENIEITQYSNKFLIRYAEEIGARYVLRGIRNANDYEYEKTWRQVNSDLNPLVTTIFLIPPREIAEISSSVVRGLVGPDGWEEIVCKYVPACVLERMKEMHGLKKGSG